MNRRAKIAIAASAGALLVIALVLLLRGPSTPGTNGASSSSAQAASPASEESSRMAPITESIRDRKVRDEVRRRIYAARSETPPEPRGARRGAGTIDGRADGGAEPGPQSSGATSREPGLDATYIRQVVRDDFAPMAKQCYESALAQNPKLSGKLVVFFTIVGDEKVGGIVESAEIADGTTIEDERLQQCFTESMMTVAFKPPRKGGKVTVKYPFTLTNDDEEDGGR